MPKESKKSVRFALHDDTVEMIKNNYKKVHCRYPAQYIENAVDFYTGYINADRESYYIPKAILSNLKAIVDFSESNIFRMLFKQAVELAMIENILAATNDIDESDIERLRGECVDIVKRTNGNFKMEHAVKWQKD